MSLELFVCVSLVRFLHSEKSFAETSLDSPSQGGVGPPLEAGEAGETAASVLRAERESNDCCLVSVGSAQAAWALLPGELHQTSC